MTPATLKILKRRLYSANASSLRHGHSDRLELYMLEALYDNSAGGKKYPVCPYCGRDLRGKMLSLDHLVPFAEGGRNVIGNIQFVCSRDNRYKRSLPDAMFRKLLKVLKDADLLVTFFSTYQPRRGRRW